MVMSIVGKIQDHLLVFLSISGTSDGRWGNTVLVHVYYIWTY